MDAVRVLGLDVAGEWAEDGGGVPVLVSDMELAEDELLDEGLDGDEGVVLGAVQDGELGVVQDGVLDEV